MDKNIWVVMQNDFPIGAFDNERLADEYIEARRIVDRSNYPERNINYQHYVFKLNERRYVV